MVQAMLPSVFELVCVASNHDDAKSAGLDGVKRLCAGCRDSGNWIERRACILDLEADLATGLIKAGAKGEDDILVECARTAVRQHIG